MNSDPIGLMLKIYDENRKKLEGSIRESGGNPELVLECHGELLKNLARNFITLNSVWVGDPPVSVVKS